MLIYMSTFENTAAASLDIGEKAISRPKSWFPRARFTPCAIGAGAECVRDYEFCSLGKGLNKIEQTERNMFVGFLNLNYLSAANYRVCP